jgi:hypothetical protein
MANPKVVCITNLDEELRQMVAGQALPGMDVISESLSADEGELMELVSDADFMIIWPAHIPMIFCERPNSASWCNASALVTTRSI